jgi:hypothetical protein
LQESVVRCSLNTTVVTDERSELLNVKADLERELGRLVLNSARAAMQW